MRKVKRLLLSVAAASLLFSASEASAAEKSRKKLSVREKYSQAYYQVRRTHGKRAPGRNIRKYGVRFDYKRNNKPGPWGTRPAKYREIRKSLNQLRRLVQKPHWLLVRTAVPPKNAPSGALSPGVAPGGTLRRITQCESGGNYGTNTGNGYYGAYQFDLQTWRSVGGYGLPSNASPAEQDRRAAMLYSRRGASPWPVCGYR